MDPTKAADAFRTISEVAEDLDLPQHVLRFWETRFAQIKPMKRGGGRRYYRPEDVELLRGIRTLLYAQGLTIRGVQKILKEKGASHVAEAGRSGAEQPPFGERDVAFDHEEQAGDEDIPAEASVREREPVEADAPAFGPAGKRPGEAAQPPSPQQQDIAPRAIEGPVRRQLEAVLAELLEARRWLDQAR